MGIFQIHGKEVSMDEFENHINEVFNLVDPDLKIKLKAVGDNEVLLQSYGETIWRGSPENLSRAVDLANGDLWEFFIRLDEEHIDVPIAH